MTTYANGNPAPIEAYAVVKPVTARELLALADVPNVRIEEYEEHRNDRAQQGGLINLRFEDGQGKRYTLY